MGREDRVVQIKCRELTLSKHNSSEKRTLASCFCFPCTKRVCAGDTIQRATFQRVHARAFSLACGISSLWRGEISVVPWISRHSHPDNPGSPLLSCPSREHSWQDFIIPQLGNITHSPHTHTLGSWLTRSIIISKAEGLICNNTHHISLLMNSHPHIPLWGHPHPVSQLGSCRKNSPTMPVTGS